MSKTSDWRPSWWTEANHGSAWERTKEALRRDWTQTKHDLHMGGHEMNQSISDTVKQAAGKEPLPSYEDANPPKVVGEWEDVEGLYRYGFAARSQFGAQHPTWTQELEDTLKSEWPAQQDGHPHHWASARRYVRRGYEFGPPPR